MSYVVILQFNKVVIFLKDSLIWHNSLNKNLWDEFSSGTTLVQLSGTGWFAASCHDKYEKWLELRNSLIYSFSINK